MSKDWITRAALVLLCIVCVETTWIMCQPVRTPEDKLLTAINASHEQQMLTLTELKDLLSKHQTGKPAGAHE